MAGHKFNSVSHHFYIFDCKRKEIKKNGRNAILIVDKYLHYFSRQTGDHFQRLVIPSGKANVLHTLVDVSFDVASVWQTVPVQQLNKLGIKSPELIAPNVSVSSSLIGNFPKKNLFYRSNSMRSRRSLFNEWKKNCPNY